MQEKEPWCFTNDDLTKKEVCGIPVCSTFNLWLYIAVPTVSGLAIIGRTAHAYLWEIRKIMISKIRKITLYKSA